MLNMEQLIRDAEMDSADLTQESPLVGLYPEIFERGRIVTTEFEWTYGSRWVLDSYEIEGAGLRASLVWYFDATDRLWYHQGNRTEPDEALEFPQFNENHSSDILRLIPEDLIPDDWRNGAPGVAA